MRRFVVVVATLVAFAAISIVVAMADPWDPLGGLVGVGVLLAACAGAVAAGGDARWLPLVLVPVVPLLLLNRASEPEVFDVLVVPVLVVLALVTSIAALALRRRLGRAVGAVLVAGASVVTAVGVWLDLRVVDRTPAHPRYVETAPAGYGGFRIGMPAARARDALTRVRGAAPNDDSGPSSMSYDRSRRRGPVTIYVTRGRLTTLATGDPDAETRRGVGIGDSIAIARRRYPRHDCGGEVLGSDATNPGYPSCRIRLASGQILYFGGDPIDTIYLATKRAFG